MIVTSSIPVKTLERLLLYRWTLKNYLDPENTHIVSRRLSEITGFSPAQIRRDFMSIGYSGSSAHGYKIKDLINAIDKAICPHSAQNIAVAGIGQLGKAVINYIQGRSTLLKIKAAFDNDPEKINKVFHGVRTYHTDEIEKIIRKEDISMAILALPPANAQEIAMNLVNAGVKAFLNYSPIKLNLPEHVYIENRDMLLAVEKIAYFARSLKKGTDENEGIS
ncbi:redox-sensing transcriptional repressor Rex [candidate division KSB1 bacterium]|nr:MAG: redox-sensing transcriptional repressor Rex [candidate division KSB1 bacterium]